MPIFEYRCGDCGTSFEKLVRGNGSDVSCPSCAGRQLEQQYSTFAAKADGGGAAQQMCGGPACQRGMCGPNN